MLKERRQACQWQGKSQIQLLPQKLLHGTLSVRLLHKLIQVHNVCVIPPTLGGNLIYYWEEGWTVNGCKQKGSAERGRDPEDELEDVFFFFYTSCQVYAFCQWVDFVVQGVQVAAVVVAVLLQLWKTGKCVPTFIRWLIRLLNLLVTCPQFRWAAYLRSESSLRQRQIILVLNTLNRAL